MAVRPYFSLLSYCYLLSQQCSMGVGSVPLMFGFIASLVYIIWLVECPDCHSSFGQRHIFNVASICLLGNSKFAPTAG